MNYHRKYVKYRKKYNELKQLMNLDIDTTSDNNMIDANNEFTIDLFENLDGASNIFSPLAISFPLSLIQLGCIGQTSTQMTNILGHMYSIDELLILKKSFNNQVLKIENMLIYNKKINIKPAYIDMINTLTLLAPFDSVTTHKINNRIEHITDGTIKDIIPPESSNKKNSVTIVSVAYLKASWQHKFDVKNTKKVIFHQTENNVVELMHQINNFKYYGDKSIQLVELPYDERDYVMGIILPRRFLDATNIDYTINNIPQFSRQEMNELINNAEYRLVDLSIPKFIQNKRFDMIPILKKMGLNKIFNQDKSEFDIAKEHIYVSNYVHESLIIVDEMGMESSSEKNVSISSNKKPVIFRADHAFVYYVRHIPSGLFLFYGDYQGNKQTIV